MSMPGFGADASLYKTEQGYRGFLGAAGSNPAYGVVPQYFTRWSCFLNCLGDNVGDPFVVPNCRCICYGHPGRTCVLQ